MRKLSLMCGASIMGKRIFHICSKRQAKMAKLLFLIMALMLQGAAHSESLFSLNASQQGNYTEPKPLFGSVRARNIGDLITIIVSEAPTLSDKGTYQTQKDSGILENITKTVNSVFNTNLSGDFNGMNNSLDAKGGTTVQRQMAIKDKVGVQVVQVMPNGNLLVQGKKSLVNANERMDFMVSGIVDPRWINQAGEVTSNHVANLQFASTGAGTVSRGQNEGPFVRLFRMVF